MGRRSAKVDPAAEPLHQGVETRTIDGVKVRIATPAKTVADCFRFQRHVGLEVACAALTEYPRGRRGSIDGWVAAARADRVHARMRPYLKALARAAHTPLQIVSSIGSSARRFVTTSRASADTPSDANTCATISGLARIRWSAPCHARSIETP
jgi:hypothetical protein